MIGKVMLIAEVKTRAPSGWKSELSWDELFAIANGCEFTDMLSIFIDSRWGGSPELVAKARKMTDKLILAKGMNDDETLVAEAFDAGANYALAVGRVPLENPQRFLIEPYTLEELCAVPHHLYTVWNSRDLRKLDQPENRKSETFEQARKVFPGWLCQASNVSTVLDIDPGANAVLVGTHLPTFIESARRLKKVMSW
ncbi:hypothetical protein A3G63_00595 [Candidatus Kaiserbacteria bacterium RIFCSPLOWO2_12_FULL_52_8]|uniref:Indole-3-glycerol-phosphate synthase n=1 Tax=Candidatus Kaiserbacteria bacterium RIFCSPHIGHO2_01_FULL_53_31 TaxID=1798481 RepID=A0A1F6CIK9_9BACT|nr:MAG: hypothetical protein A2678_01115 [Candidatus Kaiserbacteria bacterium RIFCSPHIGHO2_01_FULL_53_31]OGG92660.1 MAG: hypothetical protein A3G63_00595 [Candidatus Kaiserbacteria bacterium RIFCSPLOWO2_12_FULL_52_8]